MKLEKGGPKLKNEDSLLKMENSARKPIFPESLQKGTYTLCWTSDLEEYKIIYSVVLSY